MNKNLVYIFFILLFVVNDQVMHCQILQKQTDGLIELGSIGNAKQNILTKKFVTKTIPVLKNKIRVSISVLDFNKTNFKKYRKTALRQNSKVNVVYNDSIYKKSKYIKLKIMDQVQLLKELNADYNSALLVFLQNSYDNSLLLEVSSYFNDIDLNTILQAEEIYLVNKKSQKYSLELVKNEKPFAVIDLSDIVTFEYKTVSFCWKKVHGKVSVANFIEKGENCSKNTDKRTSKLEKKVNYFKM